MKYPMIFIYNYLIRNKKKLIKGGQEIYIENFAKELKKNKVKYQLIYKVPKFRHIIKSIFYFEKNKK